MKTASLMLPGRYEDAFVYMGRIAVLTEARSLRLFDVDKIVEDIERRDPQRSPVATLMFSRNDWLSSAVFKTLTQNDDVASSLTSAFARFPRPNYEVGAGFLIYEENLGLPANIILDMNVYNGRIYVGSDKGLFHLDFDWRDGGISHSNGIKKRTDARCNSTSVGYGTVNASCEDDGLLTSLDDFGWAGEKHGLRMRRVAEKSLRTNWLSSDLVNYSTATQPVLLRSKLEKVRKSSMTEEHERRVITEIGGRRTDLYYLFEALQSKFRFRMESIQFVYNSTSVFFVHTIEGNFYSVGVKRSSQSDPKLSFTKTYKGAGTRILSVNPTNLGLVVEIDHRVLLFANQEWYPIIESEAISVRTFPRSRRFKNLVAITLEDGVLLVGLFDDSTFRDGSLEP